MVKLYYILNKILNTKFPPGGEFPPVESPGVEKVAPNLVDQITPSKKFQFDLKPFKHLYLTARWP